jgi:VanZ family protein
VNKRLITIVWRWLPLIAMMAAIFYLSDQAKQDIPAFGTWDLLVKKGAHFSAYAALYAFALRATRNPWIALALAIVYAASDEYHQSFVMGRNGTVMDVLIDSVGALTAHLTRRWWQETRIGRWLVLT